MELQSFSGMPGVRAKSLKGPMKRTVRGILAALREHRICCASGCDGSITVYIDDERHYRCHFGRYRGTVDEKTYTTKVAVGRWLVEWMPKLENSDEHDD